MIGTWLRNYQPSLRRWIGAFACAWLISAAVVGPVAVALLDEIRDDARTTYAKEIPSLLDRNRNAMKLERLSSFMRTIASDPCAPEQRRVLLQLQTLAQGFDLDDDVRLSQGAALVVANARKILALRAPHPQKTDTAVKAAIDPATSGEDAAHQARRLSEDTLDTLASLTDYVTTDAALSADRIASRIQTNATRIRYGCLTALAFFIAFGLFLLWFFSTHVLGPIMIAVQGLKAASSPTPIDIALPRMRFFELDLIRRSVEQHAKFASNLRDANSALQALSSQDGLTGLANRRGFDAVIADACRRAQDDIGGFALLLIDIDRFKLLNDRYGHVVGDHCLRQVGQTLQEACGPFGGVAARYGGEEFAVLVFDMTAEQVCLLAEGIRASVACSPFEAEDVRLAIDMTVSIGVALVPSGEVTTPDLAVRKADEALYGAKHSGRNRIVRFNDDAEAFGLAEAS